MRLMWTWCLSVGDRSRVSWELVRVLALVDMVDLV